MEFWKHLAEGKGLFLPEELELPVEDMVKTRNKASGQEQETPYDTSNCFFLSSQGTLGGQELMELGFSDAIGRTRQSHCRDPSRDALTDQIGIDYYTSSNVVSQEKELGSRMLGSFVESDGLDLATIDLKLGGMADSTGARYGESSKDAPSVHSSTPSMPTKRARLTSLYSQTPICQVHGCNKDLSSSKDYYKRHKVCDAHTKTAKVIVKGIEQRFCQQCSRFHLLAEFDDGKRSCRKRLANHNERRRKPPGARFLSSSIRRTSFLFQEMLPTFSGPSRHEPGKWFGQMKFEDPNLDSNSLLTFRDNISVGTIDKMVGVAVPSDLEFSHIPDSSRALSLLSAQSMKAPDQLLGTTTSTPVAATLRQHHYSSAQGLTYSSANLEKIGTSGFYFPEKAGHATTISSDAVGGAGLKGPDGGIVIGTNTSNSKYYLSSGQGTMVDLFQLSSHLQMVEHKRNLMH